MNLLSELTGPRFALVSHPVSDALSISGRRLEEAYNAAKADPAFHEELAWYRREYIGGPTPMYHAKRLSEEMGGAQARRSYCRLRALVSSQDGYRLRAVSASRVDMPSHLFFSSSRLSVGNSEGYFSLLFAIAPSLAQLLEAKNCRRISSQEASAPRRPRFSSLSSGWGGQTGGALRSQPVLV